MQRPDIGQLVDVLGPTAAIFLGTVMFFAWLFMSSRNIQSESVADKIDALKNEIAAQHREFADLRRDVADLRRDLSVVRESMAGMKATIEHLKERK